MGLFHWSRIALVAATMALMTGCVVHEGPVGPPGSLNRLTVAAIADETGEVAVLLPEVPDHGVMNPPGLDCYLTDVPSAGEWQVMAEGYSAGSAFCTVSLDDGIWVARAYQMQDGWTALWVVTW